MIEMMLPSHVHTARISPFFPRPYGAHVVIGFALTRENTPSEIRLFGSAGVHYDLGWRQKLTTEKNVKTI